MVVIMVVVVGIKAGGTMGADVVVDVVVVDMVVVATAAMDMVEACSMAEVAEEEVVDAMTLTPLRAKTMAGVVVVMVVMDMVVEIKAVKAGADEVADVVVVVVVDVVVVATAAMDMVKACSMVGMADVVEMVRPKPSSKMVRACATTICFPPQQRHTFRLFGRLW